MLKVHSVETFGTQDGPGIRLVIFTQGCDFKCLYCHNPDTISLENEQVKEMSADQILDLLNRQKEYFSNGGGLTISGGEPTLHTQELIKLFEKVKNAGFHTCLDTNGSIATEEVKRLYGLTDLIMLDVKHINDQWHRKLTGKSNRNTLEMAKYRESTGKDIWLRYVLVPGWSDQEEYLKEWARYFSNFKTIKRIEILPYHKLGVNKYEELGWEYELKGVEPPSKESIAKTKEIFEKYLKNVVVSV